MHSAIRSAFFSLGNMFTGAGIIWSIASQLTAPIFHGGALEAQRQAADDAFKSQAATYRQTILTAFGQVADVLTALENDAQLFDYQRSALESADTTRQLIRETFLYGGVTALQVLDAERQFEQTRLATPRPNASSTAPSSSTPWAAHGGIGAPRTSTGPSTSLIQQQAYQVFIESLEGRLLESGFSEPPGPAHRTGTEDLRARGGFEIDRFGESGIAVRVDRGAAEEHLHALRGQKGNVRAVLVPESAAISQRIAIVPFIADDIRSKIAGPIAGALEERLIRFRNPIGKPG